MMTSQGNVVQIQASNSVAKLNVLVKAYLRVIVTRVPEYGDALPEDARHG